MAEGLVAACYTRRPRIQPLVPRRWSPSHGQPIEVDFHRWLFITWADIVAHSDPEKRRKHRAHQSARRMAVYVAKYGTAGRKDYQAPRSPRVGAG